MDSERAIGLEAIQGDEATQRRRMDALAYANEVRTRRAAIKLALYERFLAVEHVIDDFSVQSMSIDDLLAETGCGKAPRKRNPTTNRRVLRVVQISGHRLIGELNVRQRNQLLEAIGDETGFGVLLEPGAAVPTSKNPAYREMFPRAQTVATELLSQGPTYE